MPYWRRCEMAKTKTYLEMKKKMTVSKELMAEAKEFAKVKKLITNALKAEPKTVPEIAEMLSMPSSEVLYWMMTMRKYEAIVEIGRADEDGYYKYTLVKRGK